MQRTAYCFVILLLAFAAQTLVAQTRTVTARVVDSTDGTAMPYVNVYASTGIGVISNQEGQFTIEVDGEATLRLSYVGYQTLTVKATEAGRTVRLTPLSVAIGEVEILAPNAILQRVEARLNADYKKARRQTTRFFNRITVDYYQHHEMLESFVGACSAVNLRKLEVYSGQYWAKDDAGTPIEATLRKTDIHKELSLAPLVRAETYWTSIVQMTLPFSQSKRTANYRRHYDTSIRRLTSSHGNDIYCITLKAKASAPEKILCGTLYVDAQTYQLLQFDGQVDRLKLYVGSNNDQVQVRIPFTLDLHITYRHSRGFTEIDNLSYSMSGDGLDIHSTLARVSDDVQPVSHGIELDANLIEAIDLAGFNAEQESRYNIMQRTSAESKLLK